MSRGFIAVTESGTSYRHLPDSSYITVLKPGRVDEVFRTGGIKVVSHEVVRAWDRLNFDYIHDLPLTDYPVVGDHIFVSSLNAWRFSTPVQAVIEIHRKAE